MKKMMKKSSSKSANVTATKNAQASVNKTPTKYTGGKNATVSVEKNPTKYTGGKDTPPTGAVPAAKYGTMMKKGGAMSKYKSGGQGPANKIGKMVKISKKMK